MRYFNFGIVGERRIPQRTEPSPAAQLTRNHTFYFVQHQYIELQKLLNILYQEQMHEPPERDSIPLQVILGLENTLCIE